MSGCTPLRHYLKMIFVTVCATLLSPARNGLAEHKQLFNNVKLLNLQCFANEQIWKFMFYCYVAYITDRKSLYN